MGSPYLSSNESIILSTNNIVVNAVPAEAILTNERLMLVDGRHTELRPHDIPFHAIEAVTLGENSDQDPMLSLSLVTGPGVTQAMGIVFPQSPKMKRVAERDEWAARIRELSVISIRESGTRATEILPPWVPGPLPEEGNKSEGPEEQPGTRSQFRNPPLAPRRTREPAPLGNRTAIAAVACVIAIIALAAGVYLFAPSLLGLGATPVTPVTPAPTPGETLVPATVVTPEATILVTAAPETTPEIVIPEKGVWIFIKYEGTYNGSAGAPQRTIDISNTGNSIRQLAARDETIFATVQKQDNSGKKLVVEFYNEGKLVRTGSISSPKGTVTLSADLKSP